MKRSGTRRPRRPATRRRRSAPYSHLWIDTVLPISKIEELVEKSGVAEPSDISFVKDCDEIGNGSIWIVTQEELNPKVIERTDHKQINHMIMLYWD